MTYISLANTPKCAIVDDEDYEKVRGYAWGLEKGRTTYYARTTDSNNDPLRIHKLILTENKLVDHINGDGLDNRKENLRYCSNSQNLANSKKRPGLLSKYKGVYLHKSTGKYAARITINYKTFSLGYHETEEAAARAYNRAAKKHFGEFARLNTIEKN